jgi:hypothetical protein
VVVETGGDERAPIILGWPFLSIAKLSSTWIVPRSISQLMIGRRGLVSRGVHSRLLSIPKHRTSTQIQLLLQRRRTTIGGGTRLSNKEKTQCGWSTLLRQSMTTFCHHHISPRRMIKEYQP